jgi:beta-glucanase (GH16 family)
MTNSKHDIKYILQADRQTSKFMTLVCNLVQTGRFEIKLAGVVANLILIAGLISTNQAFAANTNVLANPGFESGSLSGWTTFGNSIGNVSVQSGASVAHGGSYYLKVYGQFITATNYSGIYQDNLSAPSNTYTADGWAYTLYSDGGGIHGKDTMWLEVSFRDASYNALALYRSAIVTSNNLASFGGLNKWFNLQITNQCSFSNPSAQILLPGTVTNTVTNLVAPAGTVYVRYQTVFRQAPDSANPNGANGSMYFDDLTLTQATGTVVAPPVVQWNIVWSDEFNSNSINTNNWMFETGNNNGWGNDELEYYTGRTNNACVNNGILHIVARQESTNTYSYTSARMKTQNLYSKTYGRFEFRARLPHGQGYWPALWMMPRDSVYGGWAASGEIDVMENRGSTPTTTGGTIHYGGSWPDNVYSGASYVFPGGGVATNFHNYMLEWSANSIKWYVDGVLYQTQTSWWSSGGPYPAPFDQPFYLIMNLAVGGNYGGDPDGTTVFPGEMQVDYVRVYEQTAPLAFSLGPQSNGSFTLSWPTNIVCHLQIQTNSLTGTWFDMSGPTNPFVISPNPNNTCVFYRLQSP